MVRIRDYADVASISIVIVLLLVLALSTFASPPHRAPTATATTATATATARHDRVSPPRDVAVPTRRPPAPPRNASAAPLPTADVDGGRRNVGIRISPTDRKSFSSIRSPTNALFASQSVTCYNRGSACNVNSLSCRAAPFAQTSNQQHVPGPPACPPAPPATPAYYQQPPVYAPHYARVNIYQGDSYGDLAEL